VGHVVEMRGTCPFFGDARANEYNERTMSDEDPEMPERARPRVVDKRISARRSAEAPPEPGESEESEETRVDPLIAEAPSEEWIVNVALTLGNVAGVKLDEGKLDDAELAIDALAAIVNEVGLRLREAEAPLRQMLAQLQMTYADAKK
jgi:hypothetical protein